MEIGFGGGEHLASQAELHPTFTMIGCEPFMNGVAGMLEQIDDKKLSNVRIFPNDARQLLDAMPDNCLSRCFVLYPDPWPKKRHVRRRFVGPENLARLARVLKSGAELRLATDVAPLAEWMENQVSGHPAFKLEYAGCDAPVDWVQTRYEKKGIKAGRTPVYLCYSRV